MARPTICVLITCFNLERYIGEAIESVLAQQGRKPDQLIVVDDCSTDGSRDVIASYPVDLIALPRNGGVLQGMLAGLARVRTDLVCLLDGDDLWEPGKLANVAETFAGDGDLTFLTHDLSYIDSEGHRTARESRVSRVFSATPAAEWPATVKRGILTYDWHVWLGSAMSFRVATADLPGFVALADGLRDPRNTYQDWPLATWLAALPGSRCGYLPGKLLRYRVHGANHSGDARTPAKAARNFRRTANTLEAMALIQARWRPEEGDIGKIARRGAIAGWLADLYEGRRGWAEWRAFPANFPEMTRSGTLLKDSIRALTLLALGPERATRLLHRR